MLPTDTGSLRVSNWNIPVLSSALLEMCRLWRSAQSEMFRQKRATILQKWFLQVSGPITTAIGLNTIHLGDSGISVRAVAKALLPPRSSTRQVTCRTTWTVSTVMSVTNASKLGTSFSYLTINASSAKKITRMLSFAVSVKFLSVDAHLGTFLRQSEIPKPYCTLFHNTRIKRACFSHLSCARQSFTDPN